MRRRSSPTVRVGRLKLRLPGESAAAGREFADALGRGLAQRLPDGAEGRIGQVNIRLGADREGGVGPEAVSAAVARRLGGGSDA